MHPSEGFVEVKGQQNRDVCLRNDNAKVEISNSASNSRAFVSETENRKPSPQRRVFLERSDGYKNRFCLDIPTGVGVVPVEAGREGIAAARPKRKPTTKRRRSTRHLHANLLQSTATGYVNATASIPILPSRPAPTVPAIAKQNAPSNTETQATGTHETSQSSNPVLIKKAVPYTDLELANTVSDIAVVPKPYSMEKCTSAGRHEEHSLSESPVLGLFQPAAGNTKDGYPPSTLKQHQNKGKRRQDKVKDSQGENALASRESSRQTSLMWQELMRIFKTPMPHVWLKSRLQGLQMARRKQDQKRCPFPRAPTIKLTQWLAKG